MEIIDIIKDILEILLLGFILVYCFYETFLGLKHKRESNHLLAQIIKRLVELEKYIDIDRK